MNRLRNPLRRGSRAFAGLLLGQDRFEQLRAERARQREFQRLCEMRLEYAVPVKEPLVLVSQIQRSGGTLLSQLLDGHFQCHAHPGELYIGYPDKSAWPELELSSGPEYWYTILSEKPVRKYFRNGYSKHSEGNDDPSPTFPFVFPPSLQKLIFDRFASADKVKSIRDVYDAYMTSYFNAWLDNQNLYAEPKRAVTAFVPRMGMELNNIKRFFSVYPDGRYIGIIRDSKSWYVSARKHNRELYGALDKALDLWVRSARMMLKIRALYGDRVRLVSYERLISDTEHTMRSLASFIGLDFDASLLLPTFNCMPIKADSSFSVASFGVIKEGLSRYRGILSDAEIATIDQQTLDLYQQVVEFE